MILQFCQGKQFHKPCENAKNTVGGYYFGEMQYFCINSLAFVLNSAKRKVQDFMVVVPRYRQIPTLIQLTKPAPYQYKHSLCPVDECLWNWRFLEHIKQKQTLPFSKIISYSFMSCHVSICFVIDIIKQKHLDFFGRRVTWGQYVPSDSHSKKIFHLNEAIFCKDNYNS